MKRKTPLRLLAALFAVWIGIASFAVIGATPDEVLSDAVQTASDADQTQHVTYIADGKTVLSTTYRPGKKLKTPAEPTKKGSRFLYWSDSENGSAVDVTAISGSDDVTYYAVFRQTSFWDNVAFFFTGGEFTTVLKALSVGFLQTLKLFGITLAGALPLGLMISFCSTTRFKPLRLLTRALVWIIRGTPLMLQLLIIFYIPGMIMAKTPWPAGESGRFMASSIAFIINYAFYFSEIFRGGIESVPVGQTEAGQVLGMTKSQIFFKVTLLQMIKRIVPPMSNEIITLVKDTSIARIISLQEVIWAGYSFLKGSHGYSGLLWPLFFTGVYYLLFNGILTILFGKIEKKLSYFH